MRIRKSLLPLLLCCAALQVAGEVRAQASGQSDYQYHLSGNGADVKSRTSGGAALMGGGKDVDAAFQWMIQKSGGGDFVVIRASGTEAYHPYISRLGKLDSVETLIIKSRKAAGEPFVIERIRNAEALFIAGGDQANYLNFWKATPVAEAIQSLIDRQVPVGGTSAGLAVLGEFLFPAYFDTINSKEALENPFHPRLVLEKQFLKLPWLRGLITDSHFVERDRMGRLLAFMARLREDGWLKEAKAIAIDRETAVLVESDGRATLAGKNAAYFLRVEHRPEVCARDLPLTYRNLSVYKISAGASFNLAEWRGTSGVAYTLSVEKGVLHSTQARGQIY
jgi:cyanophycinase